MSLHTLLVALAVAVSTVAPSVSRSRPRTARLSRGPAWTDLKDLAVGQEANSNARELLKNTHRIAVVSLARNGDHKVTCDLFARLVRDGMNYSQDLIVVDPAATTQLFSKATTVDAAQAVANVHDIGWIVCCKYAEPNTIQIELRRNGENNQKALAISLGDENRNLIRAAVESRISVLKYFGVLPSDRRDQILRAPAASINAAERWHLAADMLAAVASMDDSAKRKQICTQVLLMADDAIKDSPSFLEAYLLKASCLDELGDEERLRQTLTAGYSKRDPSRHSPLTILELEGDHSRFARSNPGEAVDSYLGLLEINPTSLTGLWSLIDVLLSGETDDETLAEAADLAARLVAAHPHSSVAQAVSSP